MRPGPPGRGDYAPAVVDGVGAGTFGKPLLVELSHMIEQFALAVEPGVPMVVVAMFQKLAYFSREAEVYREIAARGAVTVVGLVEDTPPVLPPGVRHVLVPAVDDLEREWSVTALTPTGGATLVASDLETLDPAAPTLERGRTFRAGWSFRREEARAQVHRLRTKLGLDPATTAGVDLVLDAVALSPQRALRRAAGAGRGHDHAGAPAAAGPATPPRRARPRGHARPELTGAPDCRAWPNAC